MFGLKKVFLAPFPPQEVRRDQESVRHKCEERQQMEGRPKVAKDYETKTNKELLHLFPNNCPLQF